MVHNDTVSCFIAGQSGDSSDPAGPTSLIAITLEDH